MILSTVIADVLSAELWKIAIQLLILAAAFFICAIILGKFIRGIKNLFRIIFHK